MTHPSCPKCKRYPHACHCSEIEAATAELRAEVADWKARAEQQGEFTDAAVAMMRRVTELARTKGATQQEIDVAMLGEPRLSGDG